jgi:hypothetical protein
MRRRRKEIKKGAGVRMMIICMRRCLLVKKIGGGVERTLTKGGKEKDR